MLKPALAAHFRKYAEFHRHPVNRLTHQIAVPLIVFHIVAMLSWVTLAAPYGWLLTVGHMVAAAVVAWYLSLDFRLGVLMALLYALCFPIAAVTPKSVVIALAVIGWSIQLAGHLVWEKRSPAFLTNLLQALIGPLFFVAVAVGVWPTERASVLDLGGRRVG